MDRAQNRIPVSTRLQRIAELARSNAGLVINTLSYHLDVRLLEEAFDRTRRTAAPGIDGQLGGDYKKKLSSNLSTLVDRVKGGTYRAPNLRRAYIPKGSGKEMRPIGIPTFEDKVLQRGVSMLLTAIYEQDFLGCSFGFRPKLGAHDALETVWKDVMGLGGCWILEVDIRKFFDTLDHTHLQKIVRQRVGDGVILELIGKWLNAGVLEGSSLSYPEAGTPQGGVISPLLANVYLHEVLDKWFMETVKPALKGRSFLVRYADDFVIGFDRLSDAHQVHAALAERFAKYGLKLHPDKTRLIDFHRPDFKERAHPKYPKGLPESFDFLGFTHHWGRSLKGNLVVRQTTAKDRFARSLKKVYAWCCAHRHDPIDAQSEMLFLKVTGHYKYFGIRCNMRRIKLFARAVEKAWYRALSRRSELALSFAKFKVILTRFPIPPPCLMAPKNRLAKS